MVHDRGLEREQLRRKLEAGSSIHMPAPRRIGKTWTISRLANDLRSAGWTVVEIDVEGRETPDEFARELCVRIEAQSSIKDRFKAHVVQRLSNLLGGDWGDKPLDAIGRVDALDFAATLIETLDASGDKVAIFVDEISYFFLALAEQDQRAAHRFAYQLRALQQRHRNVRWLITGSIGLKTIAQRYKLEGAFVDYETFVLEPFLPEAARSFMRDPTIQQQFNHVFDASDDALDAMFAELGWLAPFYLRTVANAVRPSIPAADGNLAQATAGDFEAAFDSLLHPNRKGEFAIWREHIDKNLPQSDQALARMILSHLAQSSNGEQEGTIVAAAIAQDQSVTRRRVQDLLAILYNDGLLSHKVDRYAFQSGLVRRYWRKYEAD